MATVATVAPTQSAETWQEHIVLQGVSYPTYDQLVTEVGNNRPLRFTYYLGELEIMSPLFDHERAKKLFGRMIEMLTLELKIPIKSCGSTTFKSELQEAGLEPDESYYIQNEATLRGRPPELGKDPAPDLTVEVDVTTSVLDRLPIYAALGFPEIWQFIGGEIVIHRLQNDGQYLVSESSVALPMVSVKKLVEFLDRCHETDETTWMQSFRDWVRDGMK